MNKILPLSVIVLASIIASALVFISITLFRISQKLSTGNNIISTENIHFTCDSVTISPDPKKIAEQEISKHTQEKASQTVPESSENPKIVKENVTITPDAEKTPEEVFSNGTSNSDLLIRQSLGICDFITSCSAFEEAIIEADLEDKSEILKGIQLFVQKDGNLSNAEIENIVASMCDPETGNLLQLGDLFSKISREQSNLIYPHFMFSASARKILNDNEPSQNITRRFNWVLSEIFDFKKTGIDKDTSKAIDEFRERSGSNTNAQDYILDVYYPSCLTFFVSPECKDKPLEIVFSIPRGEYSDKEIVYRLKAAIVNVNGVGTVKKFEDSDINKLFREGSKEIMHNLYYVLYERA
ncbi:hypothetical protein ENBRE01_1394 [Enteropsectra breve]|nr:hypothetical protein ENBRE01_1394 [Enteropsectra breve]